MKHFDIEEQNGGRGKGGNIGKREIRKHTSQDGRPWSISSGTGAENVREALPTATKKGRVEVFSPWENHRFPEGE